MNVARKPLKSICHRVLLALAIVLALRSQAKAFQQAPGPDTVVFTTDEHLSGDLLKADSAGITFKSPVAGEIKVKWASIKELRSDKPFAVLAKHQTVSRSNAEAVVPRGQLAVTATDVQVTPASGSPKTVPIANVDQVVNAADFDRIVNHPPNLFHGWTGAAAAGVGLVRATQNSTTFTGSIDLVRAMPSVDWLRASNRTQLNYSQAYGTTSQPLTPTVKTNIFHAALERDEYLSARLYVFGGAAFDHNFSQGLDLQQQYGGGLGLTVVKTEAQGFDVKGDVHYERQSFFLPPTNLSLFGSTFAENYRRTLPRGMLLTEFGSVSPAWNNTNAYSARLGAGLVFPVYRGFAFNLGVTDDYLNNAPPSFKKNSVTFTSGIAYTFKH